MADSAIEWTDKVWNAVRGCSLVSAGCTNCYAMKQAHRFHGAGQPYDGLTRLTSRGPVWTGTARFVPEMLAAPLSWRKPARVFVNSMSDLFHDDITNEQIAAVFGVMAACRQHTFQVLTKRPERMRAWFEWVENYSLDGLDTLAPIGVACRSARRELGRLSNQDAVRISGAEGRMRGIDGARWPLPNVWLGVSCEDQRAADERIPLLLQTPAAVRFVSAEPLLGPLEFNADWLLPRCAACGRHSARKRCCEFEPDCTGGTGHSRQEQSALLDWIIVGGESGHGARSCNIAWIRSIVEQSRKAGAACFVKQMGALPFRAPTPSEAADRVAFVGLWNRSQGKGEDMSRWPEELRVREFPEVRHA